jgi:hypothetical protein
VGCNEDLLIKQKSMLGSYVYSNTIKNYLCI